MQVINEALYKKYKHDCDVERIFNGEYHLWLEEKVAELKGALEDAEEHLDYCGWGDSYERECARDEKLPEKIRKALESV